MRDVKAGGHWGRELPQETPARFRTMANVSDPSSPSVDKGRRAADCHPCAEDEYHGHSGDMWLFPIKLNIHLPDNPAPCWTDVPLGERKTCVCVFIVVLFIITKN